MVKSLSSNRLSQGLVLADGVGVRMTSALLRQRIRENVNGTDLLPFLCRALEQQGFGIFLLGGSPSVAESMAERLRQTYPALTISGHHHGYFTEQETSRVLDTIRGSGARVLVVAFGAPKQDLWIARLQRNLDVSLAIGVGGLFDFYSGRIKRAPLWVRELSLEWLYRVWQEPARMWRRYFIGVPVFLFRVLRQRLLNEGERINRDALSANQGAIHKSR